VDAMTATTDPYAHVPVPAGAEKNPYPAVLPPRGTQATTEWEDIAGMGVSRIIGGQASLDDEDDALKGVSIIYSGYQLCDGTIYVSGADDEAPSMAIHVPNELNSEQARKVTALILQIADEVDGWVAR
jgi:hypothetical protein